MASLPTNVQFISIKIGLLLASLLVGIGASDQGISYVTPRPLMDINKDLKLLFFGSQSDYFISTYAADTETAHRVCQNLTAMTGKQFHLLRIESSEEAEELRSHLEEQGISGIWTSGEKNFDGGSISLFWDTYEEGKLPMQFRDFASFRKRRDINGEAAFSTELRPYLEIEEEGPSGRCRRAKHEFTPMQCEPVQCNVTAGDCETITPPCKITSQDGCSINRPPCSAKCENCTVIPPQCWAQPKPCTVNAPNCQITRVPCTVTTPPCKTTRPPCKIINPPCNPPTTPTPCTTSKPCIPTFRKDNCTTETFPCKTNQKNETICPPPKTTCEPEIRCPPPDVCQEPPIVCPPPLIYCEPETTNCPPPIVTCPDPIIYCPEPEVNCPKPEVVCTKPQVLCSAPVVNCPGIITSCPGPEVDCPPPQVSCPPPDVICTTPEPCIPPPMNTPPPCIIEPPTTPTTEKPCNGCGCVYMNKSQKFKWDIGRCLNEFHFICEG